FSGKISGSVYPQFPTQTPLTVVFPHEKITIGPFSNYSDATGYYSLDVPAGTGFLSANLSGRFVRLINEIQPIALHTANVSIPGTHEFSWSDSDGSYKKEESNVYYFGNVVHDYFFNVLNVSELNGTMPAHVQVAGSCNAFADGVEIYFIKAGGGCEATSLSSDVIFHEYTHNAIFAIYGNEPVFNQEYWAIHEGLADYFAAHLNNDPQVAEEIFPDKKPLRSLNNTRKYSSRTGEEHDDGEILGGAMWDLRSSLGSNLTNALLIRAMRMRGQSFSDYASNLLLADDDNANLTDGTPHKLQICDAFFTKHGIRSSLCLPPIPANTTLFSFVNVTAVPIHDLNTSFVTLNVPSLSNRSIQLLRVFLNISHTFIGDMDIVLKSPDGRRVTLHHFSGSSQNDILTWYENETEAAIGTLDSFINTSPSGNWTLSVFDRFGADEGQVNEFRLAFYLDANAPVPTPQPPNPTPIPSPNPSPSPTPMPTPSPTPQPVFVTVLEPRLNTVVHDDFIFFTVQTDQDALCQYNVLDCFTETNGSARCRQTGFSPMSYTGGLFHDQRVFMNNTAFNEYIRLDALCQSGTGGSGYNYTQFTVNITDVLSPFAFIVSADLGETQPGPIDFQAFAHDFGPRNLSGVANVTLNITFFAGHPSSYLSLFDDGLHRDEQSGDGLYGATWNNVEAGEFFVSVNVTDRSGNSDQTSYAFPLSTRAWNKTSHLLFVNASFVDGYLSKNASLYFVNALNKTGYAFDTFNTYDWISPSYSSLSNYSAIVWSQPSYWLWSRAMQKKMARYLGAGGKLFISGQDVEVLNWVNESFYQNYLGANFLNEQRYRFVNGSRSDVISDGLNFSIQDGAGAQNQFYPTEIEPFGRAVSIFTYDRNVTLPIGTLPSKTSVIWPLMNRTLVSEPFVGSNASAGVRLDNGTFKTVYLAFGFEGIATESDRNNLMDRILTWFVPLPNLNLTGPQNTTLLSSSVLFSAQADLSSKMALRIDQGALIEVCTNCTTFDRIATVAEGSHTVQVYAYNVLGKPNVRNVSF
ncbi:MAG TPA: proprotein convertase P-domain-containing protein, partial [Candidatus Norongarragalinales archaeon]|nr:proprotein convertase P-domain-containing protein [Candidatus Norongarragalinales archaeon]